MALVFEYLGTFEETPIKIIYYKLQPNAFKFAKFFAILVLHELLALICQTFLSSVYASFVMSLIYLKTFTWFTQRVVFAAAANIISIQFFMSL